MEAVTDCDFGSAGQFLDECAFAGTGHAHYCDDLCLADVVVWGTAIAIVDGATAVREHVDESHACVI